MMRFFINVIFLALLGISTAFAKQSVQEVNNTVNALVQNMVILHDLLAETPGLPQGIEKKWACNCSQQSRFRDSESPCLKAVKKISTTVRASREKYNKGLQKLINIRSLKLASEARIKSIDAVLAIAKSNSKIPQSSIRKLEREKTYLERDLKKQSVAQAQAQIDAYHEAREGFASVDSFDQSPITVSKSSLGNSLQNLSLFGVPQNYEVLTDIVWRPNSQVAYRVGDRYNYKYHAVLDPEGVEVYRELVKAVFDCE